MTQQEVALMELAANVTLAVIPVTAAYAPLATALESAINPFIMGALAGSTTPQMVFAGYGALLGVIGTLKAQTNLAPEVLAKLDEYATAAQNGTMAALAAGTKGYDPSQLTPVAPIA